MLNAKRRAILGKCEIFDYSPFEKKGKAIKYHIQNGIRATKEFIVPDTHKIFEMMCDRIREAGFKNIEITDRAKANCIIRVYRKKHYRYDDLVYNFYGAKCYTKPFGITVDKEFCFKFWECQDESITIEPDYKDFYVRIS